MHIVNILMQAHYAIQTCDRSSWQGNDRYCSNDRAELTRKSVTSFLISVKYLSSKVNAFTQYVKIFDDNSSTETKQFLNEVAKKFSDTKIKIEVSQTSNTGIKSSISECYDWLAKNGKGYVYQVQDDYLFEPDALYQMIGIWFHVKEQTDTDCIVIPYNNPLLWGVNYVNRPTPRTLFLGEKQYWIQTYDTACTFLTTKDQFIQHRELYEKFLSLLDKPASEITELESISLNHMFTRKGVLGVMPMTSLALHMQTETEKDPYIDWKTRWDKVPDLVDINY